MSSERSPRTEIRDAVAETLGKISAEIAPSEWLTSPEIHKEWLSQDQATRYPALCVVLTDEDYTNYTLTGITVAVTMKIIGWVRDENDCRAALDNLIEDTIRAISADEGFRAAVRTLSLESCICDEGSSVAKPFAQFVMTWVVTFDRQFGFAG